MSNLIELQNQIDALQKKANEIKAKEFDSTVQDILSKMAAFGISLKDLQSPKSGKTVRAGKTSKTGRLGRPPKSAVDSKLMTDRVGNKKTGVAVAPKFQGPNGESWSGRGLTPRWLSALIAQGRAREEFAVKAA
jgi:DNA-binding protein H-NS